MSRPKLLICPYCGDPQPRAERCRSCAGQFESLSRQASHNAMGPWYLRDPGRPFRPGFSYETMVRLIERGIITERSIMRGPTTRQFWNIARRVPGAAHLLGRCHACDEHVSPEDHGCGHCGAAFGAFLERNHLGLPEVRPMPDDVNAMDDSDHLVAAAAAGVELALQPFDRASGRQALSSFASNHELIDRPRSVAPMSESEPRVNGASSPMRSPGVDEVLRHPAARSLQRRVAHQQRSIRILAVLLAIAGMTAVITSVVAFRARPEAVRPSTTPFAAGGSAPRLPDESPREDASRSDDAPATDVVAESGAPDSFPPIAVAPEVDPALERFETASALFAAALDRSRALTERLADAESALALLQDVQRLLPPDEQPAGLTPLLARVEEEIERLELRVFFGG